MSTDDSWDLSDENSRLRSGNHNTEAVPPVSAAPPPSPLPQAATSAGSLVVVSAAPPAPAAVAVPFPVATADAQPPSPSPAPSPLPLPNPSPAPSPLPQAATSAGAGADMAGERGPRAKSTSQLPPFSASPRARSASTWQPLSSTEPPPAKPEMSLGERTKSPSQPGNPPASTSPLRTKSTSQPPTLTAAARTASTAPLGPMPALPSAAEPPILLTEVVEPAPILLTKVVEPPILLTKIVDQPEHSPSQPPDLAPRAKSSSQSGPLPAPPDPTPRAKSSSQSGPLPAPPDPTPRAKSSSQSGPIAQPPDLTPSAKSISQSGPITAPPDLPPRAKSSSQSGPLPAPPDPTPRAKSSSQSGPLPAPPDLTPRAKSSSQSGPLPAPPDPTPRAKSSSQSGPLPAPPDLAPRAKSISQPPPFTAAHRAKSISQSGTAPPSSALVTTSAKFDASDAAPAQPPRSKAISQPGALPAIPTPAATAAVAVAPASSAATAVTSRPGTERLRSSDLLADVDLESNDPVAIAALLLQRARADLAELRGHYDRHDIVVLLLALVLIAVAGQFHKTLVTPPSTGFAERGLSFERSQGWLAPEPMAPISPRLLQRPEWFAAPDPRRESTYHVEFAYAGDASVRLEVLIDQKPAWSNIVSGLDLGRRTRWGELYSLESSRVRSIAGHDWLRTSFRYAHAADKGDRPRVDRAVEYATVGRDRLYVISMYGSDSQLELIENTIAPTLRVETRTGAPLLPQEGRLKEQLSRRTIPAAVENAFRSTVMVIVADLIDGQLRARGGGSGVVVGRDGSIVTNFHVIHDKNGRLHDLFVIGRYIEPDRAPQLWCAGSPSRSKHQIEVDLALIKCDIDLDGRTWNPSWSGQWPTLKNAPVGELEQGQRLWVLGYPDVGGGGLTASFGVVEGWTGEERGVGRDFIKTDASITHGNSGGPVVNDQGEFVGIASAFRTKVTLNGGLIETSKIGLVRPRNAAAVLVAIAATGWTPREKRNKVELEPDAIEAPAEGIRLETRVLDADNDKPIADAMLMVLRPGVRTSEIDMNRLDDQVLAWGRTNSQGEVRLKQPVPVPGEYSVIVFAKGYAPLIGDQELKLTETTPPGYDPWGAVRLTR